MKNVEKMYIGCLAVCMHGRVGVITGYNPKKKLWTGTPIKDTAHKDTKSWQSKNPRVLGKIHATIIS